jgi:hypothetical protein
MLSVVVACVENPESLRECIDSLVQSCAEIEAEIIVVSPLAEVEGIAKATQVRFETAPTGSLVPHLWARGIAASAGSVVALTISQCRASRAWAKSLKDAVHGGAAAAGGPLTLSPEASATDSAVFFLRYSAFLPGPRRSTTSIAGDNCAYSRESLNNGWWDVESGFWEIEVNEKLLAEGKQLTWVPDAVMEFGNAGSLGGNAERRYVHGRRFGVTRTRVNDESVLRVALASPLVPPVLFGRAVRRAWSDKNMRMRLIQSIPAFAVLSAAWAFGEAVGAIRGDGANRH